MVFHKTSAKYKREKAELIRPHLNEQKRLYKAKNKLQVDGAKATDRSKKKNYLTLV